MALKFKRENPGDKYGIWVARTADPYHPYTIMETAGGYFVTVGVDGAGKGAELLAGDGNVARKYVTFRTLPHAKETAEIHHARDLREVAKVVKVAKVPHPQELRDWLESLPGGYTFKRKANLPSRHGTTKGDVVIKSGRLDGNVIKPGHWPGWYVETLMGFGNYSGSRPPSLPRAMLADGGSDTVWDNVHEVVLSDYQERKPTKARGAKTPKAKPRAKSSRRKIEWHVERDDRTTGFMWWTASIGGKEIGVSGVPAVKYPDGTVTSPRWTVYVDGEHASGPYKSPTAAKAAALKHGLDAKPTKAAKTRKHRIPKIKRIAPKVYELGHYLIREERTAGRASWNAYDMNTPGDKIAFSRLTLNETKAEAMGRLKRESE